MATAEHAARYVRRLGVLKNAPVSVQAHALGDAWFTLNALDTQRPAKVRGEAREYLRDRWTDLEELLIRLQPHEISGSITAFIDGLQVRNADSRNFLLVRKIKDRIPTDVRKALTDYEFHDREGSVYGRDDKRPFTAGAIVAAYAVWDLSRKEWTW